MAHEHCKQLTLFDLGLDLVGARSALEELVKNGKHSDNTVKGYAASWKSFERWCAKTKHAALPAAPETVKLFVGWAFAGREWRMSNLQHILSAIRDRHERAKLPSPVTREVRDVFATAKRKLCEQPLQKEPLTPQQLTKVMRHLDNSPMGKRDRALLLFGFASSWRRSEISSMRFSSVEFVKEGVLVRLGKSKGDQEGKGREIAIPFAKKRPALCPVTALADWIHERGNKPGPLFLSFYRGYKRYQVSRGIDGPGINYVVKRALRAAGIDPAPYGAHSLRSGMLTAAAATNANPIWMMQRSGHASLKTMDPYIRARKNFAMNPLKAVL